MNEAKAHFSIVDDEAAIRIPMSHFLTEIGNQVRTAEGGSAALVEIGKEIPDTLNNYSAR